MIKLRKQGLAARRVVSQPAGAEPGVKPGRRWTARPADAGAGQQLGGRPAGTRTAGGRGGLGRRLAAALTLALMTIGLSGLLAGCRGSGDDAAAGTATTTRQVAKAVRQDDYARAAGLNQALTNAGVKQATKRQPALALAAKAQAALTAGDYRTAARQFKAAQQASGDWSLLASHAAGKRKLAAQYRDNVAVARANVLAAQKIADSAPTKALTTLARVLTPAYDLPAYRTVVLAALRLKATILAAQAAGDAAAGSDTATGGQTGDATNAETGDAKASGAAAASGTAESGGSASGDAVTAAQITAARNQLRKAGTDPSFWSDADITTAIRHARKAGRSVITEADLE
ncbi:hypothetical protein [Lacticaseibacillus parakribbianus]|uniref:hypothetical protein n=1 Tax=Lacticaseibacillus parakribbianus TaxID=2970927 RepID=UPI0021CB5623|nr:hypothetical protein [Lacticaseibacillus parakribbianus]